MGKEIKKLAGKTNRTLLKLWSLVLTVVLGIMGFLTGCKPYDDIHVMYGVFVPEYGVPVAKYLDLTQNEDLE
jgi:hypothetical protein